MFCVQHPNLPTRDRCTWVTKRAGSLVAERQKPIGCEARRGAEPEKPAPNGGWERALGRIGPDSCRLKKPSAAIFVSRASVQRSFRAVASGAALRPVDPSGAATAAVVAAAAGLGYLSNCVSGARPPICGRLAPLKLLGEGVVRTRPLARERGPDGG